jgi:hypothetical protein
LEESLDLTQPAQIALGFAHQPVFRAPKKDALEATAG